MDVFGVIILLIAGIGILNLLLMAVFERTREIGILGALGIKPAQIGMLFVIEGAMMGVVGVIAGALLGLALNGILGQVGIDYSSYASMTEYMALITGKVYPTLGIENLWQRSVTVLVIAILSSLYPAREASLKEPAIALHTV
jgi:ABC-type lipoprotein release transport system permease subunit